MEIPNSSWIFSSHFLGMAPRPSSLARPTAPCRPNGPRCWRRASCYRPGCHTSRRTRCRCTAGFWAAGRQELTWMTFVLSMLFFSKWQALWRATGCEVETHHIAIYCWYSHVLALLASRWFKLVFRVLTLVNSCRWDWFSIFHSINTVIVISSTIYLVYLVGSVTVRQAFLFLRLLRLHGGVLVLLQTLVPPSKEHHVAEDVFAHGLLLLFALAADLHSSHCRWGRGLVQGLTKTIKNPWCTVTR